MIQPKCRMYWLYGLAETGLDLLWDIDNPYFEAKDVIDEATARARGVLE